MSFPQTSSEFLATFGSLDGTGYEDPVFLSDTKIGFSIQRKYPNGIRFKPALNVASEPDNIAVIWVVYKNKTEADRTGLIPLRLRIAMMSKYRSLNWDYDFSDSACPTRASLKISKKSPQPLELSLNNEFFYDAHTGGLCDSNGKEITGNQLLDILFQAHCNSVHPVKGIKHQSQKKLSELILQSFEKSINGCVWTLKNIFERTLDESRDRSVFLDGYRKEYFKKIEIDSVSLLGYKTPKRVAILFCALVVAMCLVGLPAESGSYVGTVLESKVLLTLHVLGLLLILADVFPHIIFFIMNRLISLRKKYFDRQLRSLL
jgi:hypothetical protein